MIFERHIKSARKMFHALPILGLMLCMMPAAVSARAQTLAAAGQQAASRWKAAKCRRAFSNLSRMATS